MVISKKKIVAVYLSVACVLFACIGLTVSKAATSRSYNTTIYKTSDFESESICKNTGGTKAYNNVNYIGTDGAKLVCWVEKSGGKNCTSHVTYAQTGTKNMLYDDVSSVQGKNLHLNISTSLTTMYSCSTNGSWSAD